MAAPSDGERWGILGGSFDPVHLGHINLASEIKTFKNLSGIIIIPSYKHPFKNNHNEASFDDRLEMLKLALADEPYFFISEIEKEENLSGYTINTIRALKSKYENVEFFFIIGADNITQLEKWHQPDEILKEVNLISGKRPSYENKMPDKAMYDKIEFLKTSEINISSSEIRNMIAEDKDTKELSEFLDERVLKYILEKELYK